MEGILYFAGACVPNPGRGSIGFIIDDDEGTTLQKYSSFIGSDVTCNAAHYRALIRGLKHAFRHGIEHIHIYGHSQLVVNQVNDVYEVRNPRLQYYLEIVQTILSDFESWELEHISWHENRGASSLALRCFYRRS